jgi:Zn-dependent protease/CBS domain-containing protein
MIQEQRQMTNPPVNSETGAPSPPARHIARSAFGPGAKLGTIFGIEISLDSSPLLVFGLVLLNLGLGVLPAWHPHWGAGLRWTVAVGAAVLFFGSILLHELSHAVVGGALGAKVSRITLFMFGGMAQLEREPVRASVEFWMAIVGPVTSLAIGLTSTLLGTFLGTHGLTTLPEDPLGVLRAAGPLATLLLWLGPLNVMLAVFNLLPGFPLDGGRVLRAALWWITGDLRRATRYATAVGLGLGWSMIAAGVLIAFGFHVLWFGRGFVQGLWLMLIGWFLSNAARSSYASLVTRQALEQVAVADLMWTHPEVIEPADSVKSLVRQRLLHSDQRVFPVVRDEQMVGAVTLNDVRRLPEAEWDTTTIERVMTPRSELDVLSPSTEASQALRSLSTEGRDEIPVVEGQRLRGMVRRQDLLRWLSLHVDPAQARI